MIIAGRNVEKLYIKLKNQKQIQQQPMTSPLKQRTIYALKDSSELGFMLMISSQSFFMHQYHVSGTIIQQKGINDKNVIFQGSQSVQIEKDKILEKIQVKCHQNKNQFSIPMQDYNNMIYQLTKGQRDLNQDYYNQDGDDESDEDGVYDDNSSKSQKKNYPIQSYNADSDSDSKRGRGRPKGSKNKKTLIKEIIQNNQKMMELKAAFAGKIKRGKGRPKGSKNKPKDIFRQASNIKIEQNQSALNGSYMFSGKRGKGRPKGSKNKIKPNNSNPQIGQQENRGTQKRGRGRPKGAKNRVNSVVSGTEQLQMEEEFIRVQFEYPNFDQYKELNCCSRCNQRKYKEQILTGEKDIEQIYMKLTNVMEDYGMQNKINLIILAIKFGDWETLDILLSVVKQTQTYFRPPWNVQKILEKGRYSVKTKKQYLSKTGKQGINVLLHDLWITSEIWWKDIGIQRIIQALPKQLHEGEQILTRLCNHDPELKNQIYSNIASLIRNGNFALSELILKQILHYPSYNKLNFSQEHLHLLTGNNSVLNQLKKYYIIKHNQGINYCSPIHCAAINQNSEFLKKLLQIFTDIINVQDSQHRKAIHYASMTKSTQNIAILIQKGADLRQIDIKKMTPLMLACQSDLHSNVQYILQNVRDPNYINLRSQQGYSALHYAVLVGSQDCVQALLNDPHVDLWLTTKDKQDVFHLLAGTGNLQIFYMFLKKQMRPIHSQDKYKRTPAMFAIRNHNNDFLFKILEEGCKIDKLDSSQNSLLHYAAAYGNIEAIVFLKAQNVMQTKNKKQFYPWQVAVLKGHLECAKLLQQKQLQFQHDLMLKMLGSIKGTIQYLNCIKYIFQKFVKDVFFEDKVTGNGYLHLVCSLGEDQYIKIRKTETQLSEDEIRQQFSFIQQNLIDFFLSKGLKGLIQNKKKQSPLKMCIQNTNLIGFQKLLTEIDFQLQSSYGTTIMHCLSNLACKGYDQMHFVQQKLKNSSINQLRINLKKIDHNGFDFLIYFVKNFTETVQKIFQISVKKKLNQKKCLEIAEKQSFTQFLKYEQKFIKLVNYLIDLGCDINSQVADRKGGQSLDNFKKWGIQHFLMRFPSLKLIKFIKNKIRDFNALNNQNRTPLHIFFIKNKKGNLLGTEIKLSQQYQTQKILQYLLANGLNPNFYDSHKSLPILYAAMNNQYQFILMLLKYKSQINFCTSKNQVPLIQIVKRNKYYKLQEIQILLKKGCDPNFMDMDKRNALHHLVYHCQNFDSSPEVCKLLLDYNVKINSLDKYQRSPIFYCFTKLDSQQQINQPNDKVQILQILMNVKDINLNILDIYGRTLVHYACENNYFYSILYLLDKNINIQALDYEQNTPLAVCLKSKHMDQAALIIKKGVRYGFVHTGEQKLSYFAYAIKNLSVGICFMLLDYGYPIQKALEQVPSQVFKKILISKYIK